MYKSILLFIACLFITYTSSAQHIYPEKFEGCEITSFVLDAGSTKAKPPQNFTNNFINNLNPASRSKIQGYIDVQILIDTLGKPCLISAKNETNVKSKTLKLQYAINNTPNWIPAIYEGKKSDVCVCLQMKFMNGTLSIQRRDFSERNETNMKNPGVAEEKSTNEELLSERCTVYTQANSDLPWDMSRAAICDKNGVLWFGTDNGLVEMQSDSMKIITAKNSALKPTKYDATKTTSIMGAAVDKQNNKWFIAGWEAYKFDNKSWTVYDSINSPISWAHKIYIDQSDNVWFTSSRGLIKYNGNSWSLMDMSNSKIPSNKISGVFVDSKKRTWVGTYKGNIIIENNVITVLGKDHSPLENGCIEKMYESKNGNLWFQFYYQDKPKGGIYLLKTTGEWIEIVPKHSDMFLKNSINDFLFDEERNILWIALQNVGLIKHDLTTEKWEIYTNENSNVPSTNVIDLTLDNNGIIWAATFAGIIKMTKK